MDEYMKSNNSVKIVFTSFPYMYLKGIWNPPIFNNTFIIVFSVLFVQLFAEIKLLKYIFFHMPGGLSDTDQDEQLCTIKSKRLQKPHFKRLQ